MLKDLTFVSRILPLPPSYSPSFLPLFSFASVPHGFSQLILNVFLALLTSLAGLEHKALWMVTIAATDYPKNHMIDNKWNHKF